MSIKFHLTMPLDDGSTVVETCYDLERSVIDGRVYLVAPCSYCEAPAAQRLLTTSDAAWTLLEDAGFIDNTFVEYPSSARKEAARLLRPMFACSDKCERQVLDALDRHGEPVGLVTP